MARNAHTSAFLFPQAIFKDPELSCTHFTARSYLDGLCIDPGSAARKWQKAEPALGHSHSQFLFPRSSSFKLNESWGKLYLVSSSPGLRIGPHLFGKDQWFTYYFIYSQEGPKPTDKKSQHTRRSICIFNQIKAPG